MVNIVSLHEDGFNGLPDKISNGPLYGNILNIIDTATIIVVTKQCKKDVAALEKDAGDIKYAIKSAVRSGRYVGSEWCLLNQNETWAACDSYSFVETTWIEAANKDMPCNFYIKFCISKTGNVLLTVSYHPERSRY